MPCSKENPRKDYLLGPVDGLLGDPLRPTCRPWTTFENRCGQSQLLKDTGHEAGVLSEAEEPGTSMMAILV